MPLIPFPNVPNVPGVPNILRSLTVPTPGALVNMALGGIAEYVFGPTVWGVFDQNGKEVLFPDSFLGIDYRNEARVSNYPQEKGAFASYNKVETPYDCRVQMAIGADKAGRTAFLETLESLRKGLDLLTVVTPEVSYTSANLQSYNYRRTSQNGVSMLVVELDFIEIRVTAEAQFSGEVESPKEPSAADPVSDGQVQATEPTPAEDAPTNFASGSVNDALGSTLSPGAAQQLQTEQLDPAKRAAEGMDRLNNMPPGLDAEASAKYAAAIKERYGLT